MLNIAVLSGWHVHAEGYAKELQAIPGVQVKAVWDDDKARGEQLAKELNCAFEPDVDKLLADPEIQAVQLTSQTSLHPQLLLKAAAARKHIFTEKVLTISPEDAAKAQEAIQSSGVCFAISFPHLCRPEIMKAREIVKEGKLGQIGYARVRNVHNGAVAGWLPDHFFDESVCGGGAMIDLGAHPMYTLPWLLGSPLSAQSAFTTLTGKPVEDNAVSLLRFENGTIGVSETGFVASHDPYTLDISGTQGSLQLREGLSWASEETGGKWVAITDLPAARPSPLHLWVAAIQAGEPQSDTLSDFGLAPAVALTQLMDAAYRAHRSGQEAKL